MNEKEKKIVSAVVTGLAIAGAVDIIVHRNNIKLSILGQQQHYKTKDRSPISQIAHALASQTSTGRALGWALQRVNPPRLESK